MKVIKMSEELPYSIDVVWQIISDVTRCDWVPSVNAISLDGNVRKFSMEGIGEVQEKILINDPESYKLQYSAIKAPSPLEHHLATIHLKRSGEDCVFNWISEIAPEEFGEAIESGMKISFDGLKQVLAQLD